MRVISRKQLEIAKKVQELKYNQNKTWKEVGEELGYHPDKCRSIYRRYESDLSNELSVLNILDKVNDEEILLKNRIEKILINIDEKEKSSGYGDYLIISDLHEPFCRRDYLKKIIVEAKEKGIKKCIVNGDIFHLDSASVYPVDKDSLAEYELDKVKEIFMVLSDFFEVVYVINGNHDYRLEKELMKSIKNGLKRFVKGITAIGTAIQELERDEGINNIIFTQINELRLGNVMIAHPYHYSTIPGRTVCDMVDTYLMQYRNLSAVIIGHTHKVANITYRGIYAFEIGCLCYEGDYRVVSKKRKDLWVNGYMIARINEEGNLDYNNSKVVIL